jgi:cysteinyl-tRNA synthetase
MSLHLYNSLTKREEDVEAFLGSRKEVTMYTCGPTVYSRQHIGNFSAFLMADLLRRWLEVKGYVVKHVKNITDVGHLLHDAEDGDDKIQREAEKEQVHPLEIAKKYADMYIDDERTLNILEPYARPRATEYIEQMKEIINGLLEKGIAYVTDDGIYFDVTKDPEYGKLSGNTLDHLSAGARIEVNEHKRHPADFALWKFCVGNNAHHILKWPSPSYAHGASEGRPSTDMPEGFPGWHIECSAMSRALLGDQIDIHTGGEDNIFPHHECEIAQSEHFTGKKPFVRFWLHKRRIDLAGEKMSKSLGNVVNIPDIPAKGYSVQDLRYYFLSVHYRTNMKFSWQGMDEAKSTRKKIVEWMYVVSVSSSASDASSHSVQDSITRFSEAMDSDLNVSAAIAEIFAAMSFFYKHPRVSKDDLAQYKIFIEMIRHTFGCFKPEAEEIPGDIQALVDARAKARTEKNFAESDRLRDEIISRGFELRDTEKGQVVRKA